MMKWTTPLLALVALCFTAGTASAQASCTLTVTPDKPGTAVLNCKLVWSGCPASSMTAVIEVWDGNTSKARTTQSPAGASGSLPVSYGPNQNLVSGVTYTIKGYILNSMGQTICIDTKTAQAP